MHPCANWRIRSDSVLPSKGQICSSYAVTWHVQVSTLLKEITKIPTMNPMEDTGNNQMVVNLPHATGNDMKPDKDGFYACSYIKDNMLLAHRGSNGMLVLGAPLSMVADQSRCLEPKTMGYNLVGLQLKQCGMPGVTGEEIQRKQHLINKEETVPAWTKEQWQKNVFDGYIPCSIQFEDKEALQHMEDPEYSKMTFTHESMKGRIKLERDESKKIHAASEYTSNILSVLRDGAAPAITEVHAKRVLEVPAYVGMTATDAANLKTFDWKKVRHNLHASHFFDCCST